MSQKSSKTKDMRRCRFCDQRFERAHDLEVHEKTFHVAQKHLLCQYCGLEFRHLENLNKHIKTVHLQEKRHVRDTYAARFDVKEKRRGHGSDNGKPSKKQK